MALVKVAQPSDNLLKMKPGWELVYEDSIGALFASQTCFHLPNYINMLKFSYPYLKIFFP